MSTAILMTIRIRLMALVARKCLKVLIKTLMKMWLSRKEKILGQSNPYKESLAPQITKSRNKFPTI